ncbi:MAG: alkaline phosphatase family protein [Marmoricola sp.]
MADGGASSDFVAPDWGRTLADVLPAAAAALGFEAGFPPTGLDLPEAPGYVVLLIDGLGHHLLAEHPTQAPFLHALLGVPITCGVPSTTATSLTSLGTGLGAGTHGVVGFTSRVPGSDRLLNALQWDKRVDPEDWQPHPTAFARIGAAGGHTSVVSKREFRDSGLTRASQRGASYVGADRTGERIAAIVAASAERGSLVYAYDGDLDWTGHRFGVDSAAWRAQLAAVDAAAEQLRDALPPAVRLVVVADHGMVDAPPPSRLDLDTLPVLRVGLQLLGGEARFRHLYCRAGAVDDVAAAWRAVLGERAEVLLREDAVARGWFGPVAGSVLPRLGDVVVATRGDTALLSSVDFPYETRLIGLHGSLTAREMHVPVLVC